MVRCRQLICLLLCAALLGMLPGMPAMATGVMTASIGADEYGDITFTTFDDLKILAAAAYDGTTRAVYSGEGALTVEEDLYLPPELTVTVYGQLLIPAGVTLGVEELSCDRLTVEGNLICGSCVTVKLHLKVTGQVTVQGQLRVDAETAMQGTNKLVFSSEDAQLRISQEVTDLSGLREAALDAADAPENWTYSVDAVIPDGSCLTVSEELTLPQNMDVYVLGSGSVLVSPEGCLQAQGYLALCVPLKVEGTLVNGGGVDVCYDDGGLLELAGTYTGSGILWVEAMHLATPETAVPGMKASDFLMLLQEDSYSRSWTMYLRLAHTAQAARVYGATRYQTAMKVAQLTGNVLGVERFNAVVIASGTQFADALSGSYLASVKGAPILLTNGNNAAQLHTWIREHVIPGGTVYLLGGTAAVPTTVENGLGDYVLKRLGGATRYDTNLAILREAGVSGKQIIVCTGKAFADSLSASAVGLPILLVKDRLTDAQKALLAESTGGSLVIGGTGAVSQAVEKELAAYGTVERIGGASRYETSVLVAHRFFRYPGVAVLASAGNFPDGLCAGPMAAALGIPLLLTADGKTDMVRTYAVERGLYAAYILGGSGLISDAAVRSVMGLQAEYAIEAVE